MQFALRKLLKPFAWAQSALEARFSALRPPVTFIYGENDWMDPAAGERICKRLQATAAGGAPSDGGGSGSAGIPAVMDAQGRGNSGHRGSGDGGAYRNKVLYIEDTSHFPFMEKPDEFNGMLLDVVGHCLRAPEAESGAAGAAGAVAHHGVIVDESNQGVTVDALEAAFVDA